ncbi:hypothetical protein GCM10009037_18640 [Halarchaeum grantii]|uniref:Uncharacterized protein n=1 Tax=Halarchaeum grantii TaxID=1193105 RepID=A0A830EW13_9EURY|nr:hypothetical protein [Halarchaeum grantii]GGL35275.1 hypothetical protein GCM10009037_18640 [Halarchaeum grantii]
MRGRVRVGRLVHAATYAAVTLALVWCASLAVGIVLGGPLVAAKYGLFVCGWLAVGYGTWLLRPRTRRTSEAAGERATAARGRTRYRRAVLSLPPADRFELAGTERVPSGVLLVASGVAMLAASFLLEAVAGVGG